MLDKYHNPLQTDFGAVFREETVQTGLLSPEGGSIRVLLLSHEIHPLLWRPETFGLTHHMCRSTWADVAQRRGARKQRAYHSGLAEEQVRRLGDM